MQEVRVAAGSIEKDGRLLIAKRPLRKWDGGKWEFPGGKLEIGEDYPQALKRELKEELGIEARIGDCAFEYEEARATDDTSIGLRIRFYKAEILNGELKAIEHEELAWVELERLRDYRLCAADLAFANYLLALNKAKS